MTGMKGLSRLQGLIVLTALSTSASALDIRQVQYQRDAFGPEDAYVEALYLEQRRQPSTSLQLAKVGLAFELGLEAEAMALLGSIDEQAPGDVDRRKLSLFLARNAYRAGDAEALIAALEQLGPMAPGAEGWERLLRAERHRLAGDLSAANALVVAGRKDDVLLAYARYNLAIDAIRDDRLALARALLAQVSGLRPSSTERQSLAGQARVAAAMIAPNLKQQRKLLGGLGSESESGIRALALLASVASTRGELDAAYSLWQHLIATRPWHPDVVIGHRAVPWLLEQTAGSGAAMTAYRDARVRFERRAAVLRRLPSPDPDLIARAVLGEPAVLRELDGQYGDGQWLADISGGSVRQMAARWVRLKRSTERLLARQADLTVLSSVGAEQMRRLNDSGARVEDRLYKQTLDHHARSVDEIRAALLRLRRANYGPAVDRFANDDEREMLARIDRLREQTSDGRLIERLEHLRHVVRYQIHHDLPERIQLRVVQTENAKAVQQTLAARVQRVERSALAAAGDEGIAGQITELMSRSVALQTELGIALGQTGRQLVAAVDQSVQRQLVVIDEHLLGIDIAMARLQDEMLLASEPAP